MKARMETNNLQKIKFGMRQKFSLLMVVFLLIFAAIVTLANTRLQQTTIRVSFFEKSEAITSLLKESSVDPVELLRLDLLKVFLKDVKKDPEVSYAIIYDKDGHLLADGTEENVLRDTVPTDAAGLAAVHETHPLRQTLSGIYDITLPMILSGEKIGCVRVGFSLDRTKHAIRTVRNKNIKWGLIFICVGILFALLVSNMVTRPILQLVQTTQAVARGDLTQRIQIGSRDEIEVLGTSFNRMVENLEQTTVSKKYVDDIIRSMADSLVVLGVEGVIKTVNRATIEMLGYQQNELIGKTIGFLLASHDRLFDRVETLSTEFEALDKNQETTYVTKDGREIPVSFSVSVMRDSHGKIEGVVCVAKDITERKQMTTLLLKKTQELSRSNQELEQFAYIASHDLQEPLRMVASYTQLLNQRYKGKLDQDADDFIMFASDGAARMRALIDDLLMYSRVTSKAKTMEPVDTKATFDVVVQNLKIALEERHAMVTRSDNLPVISADPVAMIQLFQNLIGNATKFRRKDVPSAVHVTCEPKDKEWIFSFKDNGIGIDSAHFERIFAIFQRLHTKEEYPGTGIGLAVCKKIVERHGGRIWLESQLGKGTTFFFTHPMTGGG